MSTALWVAALAFLSSLVHAALIGRWRELLRKHWTGSEPGDPAPPVSGVSVIVPARNEEDHIVDVLQDLYAQRGMDGLLEVIVVLDHCTDRSAALVEGMRSAWPALQVHALTDVSGKKAAITTGVRLARYPLILLTDADVRMGPERVRLVAAEMERHAADLLALPVRWLPGEGFLAGLQQDEQAALMGAAMATGLGGVPVLVNGANLAFRREAFERVGGYQGDAWASGDDMFLLQRMRKAGSRIAVSTLDAVRVDVSPERGWRAWWQQRLRWAGKMRAYRERDGLFAGLLAVLFPWLLLVATIMVARQLRMGERALYSVLLMAGAWVLWARPVIGLAMDVKERWSGTRPGPFALRTLVSLLAFTLYAPIIAIVSIFARPTWKQRRV